MEFLSTLSVRRATRPEWCQLIANGISIHALREESDVSGTAVVFGKLVISIHALREESDGNGAIGKWEKSVFLSTLSVRRATATVQSANGRNRYFYPRSP